MVFKLTKGETMITASFLDIHTIENLPPSTEAPFFGKNLFLRSFDGTYYQLAFVVKESSHINQVSSLISKFKNLSVIGRDWDYHVFLGSNEPIKLNF